MATSEELEALKEKNDVDDWIKRYRPDLSDEQVEEFDEWLKDQLEGLGDADGDKPDSMR